jgi:hypothetical protein
MEIVKGMYRIPQEGFLANKLLRKRLAPHGYYELPHTPGLWKHVSRPIQLTLVVDDFGIKYTGKEHVNNLLNALKETYEISEDWADQLYCGITLKWNYTHGHVDTSMPNYVNKQLQQYNYTKLLIHQHTPLQPAHITYGSKSQEPTPLDKTKPLNKEDTKFVQQVTCSFLYYGRAVDPMILHALSTIASQQSAPTEKTKSLVHTLLDYMATHPNSIIRFYASDMILNVHSDASYLTAPKA